MRTGLLVSILVGALSLPSLGQEAQQAAWKAPESAARKANPVVADSSSVAAGKALYIENCETCHGAKGAGDGESAKDLEPRPSSFADPHVGEQTDGEIFWKITEGNAPMPGFADSLTDEQRWHLVNYVRSLGGPVSAPSRPQAAQQPPSQTASAETQEALDELQDQVQSLRRQLDAARPGTTGFLVTGWAASGYTDSEDATSSFNGGFNPILLWRLSDRVFFEGAPEIELEDGETEVALEFANFSYLVNRNLTVSAGLFLTPIGLYVERLHPAWINKLPDAPLAFGHDGLVPNSVLGVQFRGGFAAGRSKFNYAVYAGNGPTLVTPEEDEEEAGMLSFDNFTDNNDNKAVGGRFGFLPIPNLELGAAIMRARVGEKGTEFEDVDATLSAFDLTWVRSSEALRGTLDLRAEWIRSKVDEAQDLEFANEREGGYLQLAYRPSVGSKFTRSLEGAVRFDWLDLPEGAPENMDTDRWTLGVNYWINASTAFKLAYQTLERTEMDETERANAFLVQFAVGF